MEISIVSPVYQSENLVDELVERVTAALLPLGEFELILVEDGSRDNSWDKIQENASKNPHIKGIRLSRNFGQHAAIAAGLEAARGEWTVVMDCDLQDLPEEIPALYRKAKEGYEVVLARRVVRKDQWGVRASSRLFNRILTYLSDSQYDSAVANFGIYRRSAIDAMKAVQPTLRYFPSMVKWVGFHQTALPVAHAERPRGKSTYTFAKKFKLSLNIILSYSDKLLRCIVAFGLIVSFASFVFAIFVITRAVQGRIAVLGYASLIVAISFFSGIILSVLGVLGLYIGKIFESAKTHPSYLIREKTDDSIQ